MGTRRRRVLHSRSNRGCQTCKIRKVKCDESEPYCQRCVSTGRRCDGIRPAFQFEYENRSTYRSSAELIISRIDTYPSFESPTERHTFGFYLHRVAPFLSGSLDEGFWSVLVPQLAHTDEAVRFSVLAISDFFSHPIRGSQNGILSTRPVAAEHVKPLQWYGKALSAYRQVDSRRYQSDLLAKTVILVSLEIQQNNVAAGLRLLRLAFTMVAPLLIAGCVDTSYGNATTDGVVEIVLPMFMRSAAMLLTPREELSHLIKSSRTSADLVEPVFWTLCIVWPLWKDFYLFHKTHPQLAWARLKRKHAELNNAFLLAKDILEPMRTGTVLNPSAADVLNDYCTIGLAWLGLLSLTARSATNDCEGILEIVLLHLDQFRERGVDLYPAATRTIYFQQMAILPLAYMIAVFTNDHRVRNRALYLMHCQSLRRPYTQLHAIIIPPQVQTSGVNSTSSLQVPAVSRPSEYGLTDSTLGKPPHAIITSVDDHSGLEPDAEAATSIDDPSWAKHLERSIWLTGDMLQMYPERRLVMVDTLSPLDS